MRLTQPADAPETRSVSPELLIATQSVISSGLSLMAAMDDVSSPVKNSHMKGLSNGSTNGSATNGSLSPRIDLQAESGTRRLMQITRVNPPGKSLYPDSSIDREEFVRLVLQALKDVGYRDTASVLELESGFTYETSRVTAFRRSVIEGDWNNVEKGLVALGVSNADALRVARFLINQQRYLESIEAGRNAEALSILRKEIAPLDIEQPRLHHLSGLVMSSTPDELRRRAGWDGVEGNSRHKLLTQLQQFIPSSTMVPPQRLNTLLEQARQYQIDSCIHHIGVREFSLYQDHICSRNRFPSITTHILEGHHDEVWQVQWSHSGKKLASSSRDMTVIIWRIDRNVDNSDLDCDVERVFHGHSFAMSTISWSPDDKFLLSSAEHEVKLWDVETGSCINTMIQHSQTVNGLCWLADGSGFFTGGMDRKIIQWDSQGESVFGWPTLDIRMLELAITPDSARLVAIGLLAHPVPTNTDHKPSAMAQATILQASSGVPPSNISGSTSGNSTDMERRIVVYDLATRQELWSQTVWGELQSVKISDDSRFALVNHRQGDVTLWDLEEGRLTQRFYGRPKGACVVRNCFGGLQADFILSGSDDGHIYVWHRRTGTLVEVLAGHQSGGVNSVDWCPNENAMFASCGDDGTIRIWGPEPDSAPEWITEGPINIASDTFKGALDNGQTKARERYLTPSTSREQETPPR
ncbi:WD40 repeat-like protein [Serendipita vermifera]|nr:WD40 repeat-like protein [Serendipita vermifera]